MNVILLGTGTSTGVPVIGCTCPVCRSEDARDKRTRSSCLVQVEGLNLLIDSGPDFRHQAIRERIGRMDAVLFTHHHFDHVVGMDDLRPFFFENPAPIPCFARANTAAVIRQMFPYIFCDGTYPGVPRLTLHEVEEPFEVRSRYGAGAGVRVEPIDVLHGALPIFGYRIGGFAYLTDTSRIPAASFDRLRGLDVLVLDALRHREHPMHFTVDQAVEAARQIGARRTYFVHMTHDLLHAEAEAHLPEGMYFGYDGLRLML